MVLKTDFKIKYFQYCMGTLWHFYYGCLLEHFCQVSTG